MGWGTRIAAAALAAALAAAPLDARTKRPPRQTPRSTAQHVPLVDGLVPLPAREPFAPTLNAISQRISLEHRILVDSEGSPMTLHESLPGVDDQIAFEQYLLASVGSDTIIFSAGEKPVIAYRLPEGSAARAEWRAAPEADKRSVTSRTARRVEHAVEQRLGKELTYKVGYADILVEGIKRYAPYALYFEELAVRAGLDRRMGFDAFQESNATALARSKADCEGMFQLGRYEARGRGLHVPEGKKGGIKASRHGVTYTAANESLHPLLAAEAAFALMREYAMMMGGLMPGVSAYHAGPGNIIAMRKVVAPLQADPTAAKALADQALMINGAWRRPENKSGYKSESARYLPRLLAMMAAARPERAGIPPGEWDRVDIIYRGKQTLTGSQLAKFFPSVEAYVKDNPHIPLAARVPDKFRVYLPRGSASRFFAEHPHLEPRRPVIYERGTITPAPGLGPYREPDMQYASLFARRHRGDYLGGSLGASLSELAALKARMMESYEAEPTSFRKSQLRAAAMDHDLLQFLQRKQSGAPSQPKKIKKPARTTQYARNRHR